MKDGQDNLVRGRTRWRRFAIAFVPAGMLAGILMAGVANGAVPVQLVVSGQTFEVSATSLQGQGFHQYGSVVYDTTHDPNNQMSGAHPVAVSDIKSATLTNLCQSVLVKQLGVSLLIHAGTDPNNPATATNMIITMDHLSGDATFKNIDIGKDASLLRKGSDTDYGTPGMFGQEADSVTITNLKQTAYSTQAGLFTLNGLDLRIDTSGSQCF